ncbi:TonB-system energizer ExbB [Helicobacter sp. 11S02629-2]|uniref:TonB-system energizer ExbB n=1 Tax=Helicobacter sp. 11S02629-2 TaxID=1476195 RepID=UPI000BA7544B|nr:TonB-system energizer ExbB [Helicobacter sp. 11S02629-2]PAF43492.1 TonB-system energizer ExbB [Helicobacter sp. 11S02629-2]
MSGFMEFLKEYLDPMVFSVLGFMGLLVIWFSIERIIFFSKFKLKAYKDISEVENQVTKNLTVLHIVYSNAPYVGLLGTVIGIMVVFYDMGGSGNIDVKTIMVGLSLALKATALGLVVAIPTLVLYNIFLRIAERNLNQFKTLNNISSKEEE